MGILIGVIILLLCAATSFSQCPSITVLGPAGVTNPGGEMSFQVEVGVAGPKLSYLWSLNAGTIVEGQGTAKIKIQTTTELAGTTIAASVKLEGLPSGCPDTASEFAPVAERFGCGMPMDAWGYLKPNDERGRLDLLFAELSNNPGQVALIVFTITHEDKLDSRHSRIQFVLKHVEFRKFDKGRIWFALELGEARETRLYRMPPEAEVPCSGCLVFKGEHL